MHLKIIYLIALSFFISCAHSVPFFNTLLCRTNNPLMCATTLAMDAISMTGAGAAMTLCESDPTQCKVGMAADVAVMAGATAAGHFGATAAIGSLVGAGALATSPLGGPVIIGGAVGGSALLAVTANLTGKIAYCNAICTKQLASEAGSSFQNLIKANPHANLTDIIAITKGGVTIGDQEAQQKLVNAVWCIKYCPAKFNQRFMCKMLETMSLNNSEDQESIVRYGKFLASTGTIGGFHRYIGPDQIDVSKLSVFINKNGTEPSFCYKHTDSSTNLENFQQRYNILKSIYNTFLDIKNDPFMLCSLHNLMKNGASNEALLADDPIHNQKRTKFYLVLKTEKDAGLSLIKPKGMFEREQAFCQRLATYLDTRLALVEKAR